MSYERDLRPLVRPSSGKVGKLRVNSAQEVPEVAPAFVELESGGPRLEPVGWQVRSGRTGNTRRRGTAVSSTYQTMSRRTQPSPQPGEVTVPEQVVRRLDDPDPGA